MMAVLVMCAHIVFGANARRGEIAVRRPNAVTIDTSIQQVCQSATVTLPRNIKQFEGKNLPELLRRGDPVQVWLGYDGNLQLEFEGFIESVSADIPVVVKLRDALWNVLQLPFNKSYKEAYLPTVVRDLVPASQRMTNDAPFKIQAMEANIGPIRFEKTTVAKALKALKDDYGMVTYLKGDTIYCGVLYAADAPVVKYGMEVNVRSSDLEYRTAEDIKMRVELTSLGKKGKKIKAEAGDPEGELRKLTVYGITSKEELKKLAEADLVKFKYNGYTGSFKGFGIPYCRLGDKVELTSLQYPERDGQYLAEAVKVSFDDSPAFSRDITLAQRWI